jgi:hypothetical protein
VAHSPSARSSLEFTVRFDYASRILIAKGGTERGSENRTRL